MMDLVDGLARKPIITVANVAAGFAAQDGVPSAGGARPDRRVLRREDRRRIATRTPQHGIR
jgi:hypothetical protein